MAKRYRSILDTIGNTPVVRINNLAPAGVNLFVKIEAFNPMGSVKDRLALGVIEDAECRGELKPGQTIVEATSGNTGIGLAMVCAQKGYPLVVTMAENFSVERRKLMRFLGAKVVLTPASEKGSGMVAKARELAEAHGWWQSRQFENPANADMHARTTAVEILEDFDDVTLDYWVTGFGTAGTLNGVSRVLRQRSPETRIVVCEPDNSAILASGIPQQRNSDGSHRQSHPSFRPHLMQGWSPDFVPKLAEEVLEEHRIDEYLAINGNDALSCARDLASKEGIFVGISAGATFAGALHIAAKAPPGANILCMLPDTGERYLTTPLFESIAVEMTQEEMALSRSTPGYRFDASSAPTPASAEPVALDLEAKAEVERIISDVEHPVVMFALEWCEFCWSVRKVLQHYEIPYRSIDLDSVEYQQDNRGGKIRAVLKDMTGSVTLPQLFIGGEFIGGCTELFDLCKEGTLFERLQALNVPHDAGKTVDPYSMLPSWLHPR
ncbi:cysteine synthase [Litchfieldella anticariensis FP35 = DSM 16096]|uniref:Cysteine synthase B n=1 Tax=Litchfieldella anticariensis (strain DSM 16096 / CECT 5854 / CIP 108499 / LMG 22089 / FP35) TaxID=1121939 RepID=S2KLC7_LITA3|nr:cysteine synthase A [Halomonas anticariensis]EPC02922.1 cysteine synthase [Halomonas anticariensis FP35 = DSM 16096]